MSLDRRRLIAALGLTPLAAALPAVAGQDAPANPDALLDATFSQAAPPALGAMVLTRSGVEWSGQRGVRRADGQEAVTSSDRWHLGSNTKAMTAALWARLVEQGRAAWDMPLARAFPGMAIDDGWAGVTVDDLMRHRAGLSDTQVIGMTWLMTARSDPRSLPEQRAAIAADALARPPGGPRGAFAYGNANYILVGAAIERIMGRSWEDAMRAEVFAPLDIRSGGFGAPTGANAWGHRAAGNGPAPMDPASPGADNPLALGPAGTVHMTLKEYARFLGAWLNDGGDWLRAESVRRLTTPLADETYALGWMTRDQPWGGVAGPGPVMAHEGSNTMWHAFTLVAPERGFAVAVAANDHARGRQTCPRLGQDLTRYMATRPVA